MKRTWTGTYIVVPLGVTGVRKGNPLFLSWFGSVWKALNERDKNIIVCTVVKQPKIGQ